MITEFVHLCFLLWAQQRQLTSVTRLAFFLNFTISPIPWLQGFVTTVSMEMMLIIDSGVMPCVPGGNSFLRCNPVSQYVFSIMVSSYKKHEAEIELMLRDI